MAERAFSLAPVARDHRVLVENAQDLIATYVRHLEKHALDAGVTVGLEFFLVRRRGKCGNRQGLDITPGRGRGALEALDGALGLPTVTRPRKPAIAKLDDAF